MYLDGKQIARCRSSMQTAGVMAHREPKIWWRRARWWIVIAASLVLIVLIAIDVIAAITIPSRYSAQMHAASTADRLKAEGDARSAILGLLTPVVALIAGVAALLNFQETSRQNRAQLELQRRGQVTERFSKAIEQLGQPEPHKLDVRVGAVYALEQTARDSPELHWPIMEVLTAHLREYRRTRRWTPGTQESTTEEPEQARLPAEAQAIATVIGRRRHEQDPPNQRLDLHEVDLSGVVWNEAWLEGADLRGAQLEKAILWRAQLKGAILGGPASGKRTSGGRS